MHSHELVSIIIPFRNQIQLLHECLHTMQAALGDEIKNVELILVDNNSAKAEIAQLSIPESYSYQLVHAPIEFNFQTLINLGVAASAGRFLLLLNNDIVFTEASQGFLSRMRQQAQRDEVGAVGVLLLYPDGTIQHAGAVVGMNDYADHLYRGWTKTETADFPFTAYDCDRYVSAVTAACLMVERSKYDAVAGMDERFTVCGGDVDFCLRLIEKGYKNVYLGSVELIHLESKTRDPNKIPESDYRESSRSYSAFLRQFNNRDPYYPEPLPLRHRSPQPEIEPTQPQHQIIIQKVKRKAKAKLKSFIRRARQDPFELTVATTILKVRHKLFPPAVVEPCIEPIPVENLRVPHMRPVQFHLESPVQPQPRLNILLPHLIEVGIYGGILTAALIGLKFKVKHPEISVRFLLTDGAGSIAGLRTKLRPYLGDVIDHLPVELVTLYDRNQSSVNIHTQDFFLATAWWTCYSAEKLAQATASDRPFFYLIQDFEPNFYPWNEEYASALATYQMKFLPLFNTSILKDFFVSERIFSAEKAASGTAFEPAINRSLFNERQHQTHRPGKRTLFFYGRPGVVRNLFSTGLLGIAEAIKQGILDPQGWNFISAGEIHPPIQVRDDLMIESIGKLSLDQYATLLQTVDLGVSLMLSPHPSYPPLEIAASGALCVTNFYGSKDLSQYHSNLISCDPSIAGVVAGIQTAVERLNGSESVEKIDKLIYDWDASLENTLTKIFQVMQTEQA